MAEEHLEHDRDWQHPSEADGFHNGPDGGGGRLDGTTACEKKPFHDTDIHGGHPDLPKPEAKPQRDGESSKPEPAAPEAIEPGYPLP